MQTVKRRLNILKEMLKAALKASLKVKGVPFVSGISSLFQLYGLRKMFIRRTMHVARDKEKDVACVTIQSRSIYWPAEAQVNRLVDMYFEVFYDNNHRFDVCGTPIHHGDFVIDAGCCEGYFAMLALEQGASKVICFEPGRNIGACIKRTFHREISDGRLEVMQMLLGDTLCDFGFLEDPKDPTIGQLLTSDSYSAEENVYTVSMTTLDFFLASRGAEKLDFLKIDVEGAEPEVIEGARMVIQQFKPRIAVAVYHSPQHAQQLQELISSINDEYQFYIKGLVDIEGIVRPVMLHCYVPS